jgi:hypothetical protein
MAARSFFALLALAAAFSAVGCDETPGVKDQGPPAGGPPKQERHPPGLNKDDLKKYQ